jgi:hypothetical protein
MAEDEANRISPGVKVWVPDPAEAYVSGSVVSVSGEAVKVATEAGEAELKHADLCLVEHADREDMVTLNYLHEPGVLHNLKNRYGLDEIYTYTGNILIAVRGGRNAHAPRLRERHAREPTRNRRTFPRSSSDFFFFSFVRRVWNDASFRRRVTAAFAVDAYVMLLCCSVVDEPINGPMCPTCFLTTRR